MMKMCLIVDDSEVVRRVAKAIVEELGFVTLEAENGEQALQQCRSDMPDVIILDWHMPKKDGVSFLEELAQLEDGDLPRVIFTPMEHDAPLINRAIAAGANDYLLKPYDLHHVREKLSAAGLV
ncbi:MAG: response regulator [Pseudomonadota bacterium]